jgi:hypothetical protein
MRRRENIGDMARLVVAAFGAKFDLSSDTGATLSSEEDLPAKGSPMNFDSLRKYIAGTLLAVLLIGSGAGSARAAGITWPQSAPPAVAETTGTAQTTGTEPSSAEENYAQRESRSPQAADFKGGYAGVYIGGSGVALVLLIVLLVILL